MTAPARATGPLVVLLARVLCALFMFASLQLRVARAHDAADRVLSAHLGARGGGALRVLARSFLFEGQALVRTLAFERAGCRAVLAWGGEGLRDLDLGLYSRDGSALAEDRGAPPFAYARLCAAAGTRVFASAQAYAGRGEIVLYELDDAPRSFGRPPAELPLAVAAGGQASTPRALGGDDASDSFEAPLLHDERELARVGFVAQGPPSLLEVRAGSASGTVFLRANACVRIVAFVPYARGVILSVDDAGQSREVRGADSELVRLSLCASRAGPYEVTVRTRALRSLALVRVFEHPLARAADAGLYDEERALSLAEARTLAGERGQALSHLGEAWLEGERPLGWPVTLTAGRCHMFVALPESGKSSELRLVDARGVVLAHHEGRRGTTAVFACANRDEQARLFVRASGAAGAVSLWQGQGVEK
jgi:hypothetical protein